jgi:hypothetical protein
MGYNEKQTAYERGRNGQDLLQSQGIRFTPQGRTCVRGRCRYYVPPQPHVDQGVEQLPRREGSHRRVLQG